MENENMKLSISFAKKFVKKDLSNSALGKGDTEVSINENSLRHTISSFDKDEKLPQTSKAEDMAIAMVESKRDSIFNELIEKSKKKTQLKAVVPQSKTDVEAEGRNLEEIAAAAILEESKIKLEEYRNRPVENNLAIQLDSKLPDFGMQDTAEPSTLDDYEEVNVEHFGAALLRGMGWKKEIGIGRKEKRVVEIVNPTSKGFALTPSEGRRQKGEEEEEEELKNGSHVLIHSGRNRGTYGIVEYVDEDHLLLRCARGDKVLRDVEQNIRVVSAKEYKELSRVINKEMYDEFKAAENEKKNRRDEKHNQDNDYKKRKKEDISEKGIINDDPKRKIKDAEEKEKETITSNAIRVDSKCRKDENAFRMPGKKIENYDIKERINYKDKGRDEYTKGVKEKTIEKYDKRKKIWFKYKESDEYREHKKSKELKHKGKERYKREESKTQASVPMLPPPIPWARENLRVRIIDKEYRGGCYHKQKVVVSSVETITNCTCVADDGNILYDVNPDHLETVIPKAPPGIVLIINGNYKGQKARVLETHKEKEKATLQLLQDNRVILKLYYDDICEYVSR